MTRRCLSVISGLALFVTAPRPVAGQTADHLKCYKIKDAQAKQKYTADVAGLVPEVGCLVSVPGKLLCVAATKTAVSPAPPGGGATSAAGRFVCYKLKCPKATLPPLAVSDQFGARNVQPSTPKMLCAPVELPTTTTSTTTSTATSPTATSTSTTTTTPTTSTTTSTTVTTTTTTTTTSSTIPPTCANGGIPCGAPCGTCGNGVCGGAAPSCGFLQPEHCGSTVPVCAMPVPGGGGFFTNCSSDAMCPPGMVCTAAVGNCGTGTYNACNAICPE
jgi:hypothetical protein